MMPLVPLSGVLLRGRTIASATITINVPAVNHPYAPEVNQKRGTENNRSHTQTIPAGPAGKEKESVDAIEGTRPMMLNATANI